MAGKPGNETVLRFEDVSFEFGHNKPILDTVNFNVRRGSKITIMGQNGAGKSTLFKLITGDHVPEHGSIHIHRDATIAIARQVIPRPDLELTVREFFQQCFKETIYDIDPRIDEILEVVNLHAPHDRIVKTFSGGQQARLLLASALIQNPDILLLDEPTNNLDTAGIEHLTTFIKGYKKTCLVISHDAEFLNSFTDGVLYLDIYTKKIEQYVGNYFDLLEEEKVDVRKEDKTIRPFTIPTQADVLGDIITITGFTTMDPKTHTLVPRKTKLSLKRNQHLLLKGPNGIGKSTLLEALASGTATGATITDGIRVGYYRQDFSTLNFEDTVYDSLLSVMDKHYEEQLRATASSFLITSDLIKNKIGSLSEGQKGLVAFARLVLQRPGLLILDEPTNHINFRHIPVIAEALNKFEGAMILVSHVPEFVAKIRIDDVFDLEK